MSTTAAAPSRVAGNSLAASAAFRSFATVFAIAVPVIYVVCEMASWPLFTYHPATDRVDLGWTPAVRDEGPAMYWYGWIASSLIGSTVLGLIATMLPAGMVKKIPLWLVWVTPLLLIPILTYGLRFYWRWE